MQGAARLKRLTREVSLLQTEPSPGIQCWLVDQKLDHMEASILGGKDTPYYGGVFKLDIQVSDRYPFEPPKVKFVTPIYHPNIDTAGRICLDILKMPPKGAWKPSLNISTVLTSIQVLMADPNPDDPLMTEISDEFKYNQPLFIQRAKEQTQKYATSKCTPCLTQKKNIQQKENLVGDDDSSSSESDDDHDTAECSKQPVTSTSSNKRPPLQALVNKNKYMKIN